MPLTARRPGRHDRFGLCSKSVRAFQRCSWGALQCGHFTDAMESTASCRIIFVPRDDVVVIAITRWQSSLLHSHPSYLTPTVMRFAGTGFLKSRLWKADADFRGGLPLVCFFIAMDSLSRSTHTLRTYAQHSRSGSRTRPSLTAFGAALASLCWGALRCSGPLSCSRSTAMG